MLDADALWMVGQDLSLVKGYRKAVLTPNVMEFKRLSDNAVRVHVDSLRYLPNACVYCRGLTQRARQMNMPCESHACSAA